MKRDKIIFWVATGLLSFMMLAGGIGYYLDMDKYVGIFTKLGYPGSVPQWLGAAKILGVIAIVVRKVDILKNMAYAGFLTVAVLALSAHLYYNDGEWLGAVIALVLLSISWFYNLKLERASA